MADQQQKPVGAFFEQECAEEIADNIAGLGSLYHHASFEQLALSSSNIRRRDRTESDSLLSTDATTRQNWQVGYRGGWIDHS